MEELIVYRRSVDVESVKDGHEDQTMPSAAFRVKFTRHEEYAGEARNPKTEWETSELGRATIDNLPPGELEVEWVHPYSMGVKKWVKDSPYSETGGKRKAVLKKEGCRAAFVWPPHSRLVDEVDGIRVHQQIVNLNPDDQIADDPASRFLVEGSPEFGTGQQSKSASASIPATAGDRRATRFSSRRSSAPITATGMRTRRRHSTGPRRPRAARTRRS